MVGEDVEVEHGPAPPGDPSHSSDTVELPAATYEKLRRLAAEYLRSERGSYVATNCRCTKLLCASNARITLGAAGARYRVRSAGVRRF
jgi:hypothetical protein